MEQTILKQEKPKTLSSGADTVVRLSDYRRVSYRLKRSFKRRRLSWIWAVIGAVLLTMMTLGAFSDSAILKGTAWISFGIVFLLMAPFSWWLNGSFHR